jgi:nicotinamidase-related amidase
MKWALLIIDMQKAYYQGYSRESMDKAAAVINAAAALFRKQGLPVVWIQDEGALPKGGSAGFEVIDALNQGERELRISKRYKNSFNKTGLFDALKGAGVDTVIVTGYSAAHCVLSTYRGAEDLDLFPLLLKNGTAGNAAEAVQFVEGLSELITLKTLERILTGA